MRFGLFALIGAVLVLACSERTPPSSPALELTLLGGERFVAQSEPVILINYWAKWCKPCLEEMPELNEFSRTQSVPLLALNYDLLTSELPIEAQQEQAAKLAIEFGVLDASSSRALEQRWQLPRPAGLPTTYLLNSNGVLLHTLQGVQTLDSLQEAVAQAKAAGR